MMPRSDPLSAPQSTQSPPSSTAIHDTATQAVTTPSASSSHAVRASHSQRTPSRHATPPPSLHLAQPTTTVVSSSSEGGHEAVSAHDDSTLRHSGPYRSHSSVMQRRQQPGSPVACTMSDSALHERHTHGPLVPPLMREGGDGGGSRSHSDTSSSSSEARHASTSRRSRMHNKETAADFVVETNEQQYDRHTTATTVYSSQDDARRTNSGGSETRHASRILMPHCPSPPPTTTTLLTTPSSQTQLLPPCQPSPPQPCSSSSAVVTDTLPPAATITSNSSNTRDVLPAVRCMTSTSSSSSLSQTTTMTRTTSASSRSAARMRHRLSSHTGSSGSGVSVGTSGVGNDPTTNIIGGVPMAGGMMRLPSTSASSSAELSPLPPMQLLPLTMATCAHDSNHNNDITGDATGEDARGQQQQQHQDREAHALQAAGPAAATITATQHSTQPDSESHGCTEEDNNNKKTGTAAAIVATDSTPHAVGSVHDTLAAGTAVRSSNSSSPPQAEQANNITTITNNNDAEGEADKPRHAPRLSFKERLGAGCTGLPSRLTRGRTSLRATTTSTTTTTPTLTAVTTIMRNAGRSTPSSPDISHAGHQTQTNALMHTTTPSNSSPATATATNLYRGYNPSTLTRSSAVLATSPMTHPFTTSSSTASCMTQRPSQGDASPLQQQQVETSEAANESSARSEAGRGATQSITFPTTSNSHTTASPATLCAQSHTVTPPAPDVSTTATTTLATTVGEMASRGCAQHEQQQLCEEQPMLQVDQLSADRPRAAELQTNSLTTTTNDSAAVATAERATSQSTCRYSQPSTPLAAPGTTCRSPRLMQTTNIITTPTSTRSPSSGTALHVADAAAHVTSSTTTTSNANMTTKSHSPAWHATRATTDYISTTTTTPTLTPPPPPPPSGHHRLPSTNSAATHSPRMRPKRRVWRAQMNLTGAMHATGTTVTSTSGSNNIQPKDAGSRGAGSVARTASGFVHDTHTAPLATTTNSNAPLASAHVSANASPLRQRRDRGKMLSRESSVLLVSETLAMHARTASAATSVSASALADTVHLTDTLRSGGSTGSSNGGGNSVRRHGQAQHPNDEDNKERSSERGHTGHNNNDDDERRQHEGDMLHHSSVMGGSAMAARRVLFQSDSVNAECATIADTSKHSKLSSQKPLQAMPSSPQTVAIAETTTVTASPYVMTTATTSQRDTTMPSSTVQQQPAAGVVGTTQSTFTPPTVATITTTTSPSALRHSPPCASPSVDEQHALPVDTSASTSNPSFSASSLSISATTITTTAAVTIATTTGHVDTTGGNTSHSVPPCHGSTSYQASHSPTRQGREHSVVHTVPSLLPHDTHTHTTNGNSSSDEDKTGTHSRADLSSTPLQLDPHHHHHNNNNGREDNNDDTLAHTTGSMRTMALLAGSHSLVSSFHLAGLGATSSGAAAAAAKKDNGRVSSFSSLQFSVRPRPRRRIVASERRHGTTTTAGHTSGPTRTRRAHRAGTAVRGSSSNTGGGRDKEEEKETRRVTPSAATAQRTTTTTTTEEARKDRTERTDAMHVTTTCGGGVGSAEEVAAHDVVTDAPHTSHNTTTSHAHRDRSRLHKTTTTSSSSSASAAGHSQQRRPQTAATLPRAEHTSTTSHTHPTTTTTTAIEMSHVDSDNDRNHYEEEEHVSSDLDTLQQMAGDSLSASAIDELGMMSGDEAISGGSAMVGVGMRESVTHVFLPVYELLLEANDTASESTTTTTVTANNSPRMSLRAESPFSPKSHSYSIEPTTAATTMTLQGTLGGNAMGGTMGTPALRGRSSEGAALTASPASPPPVTTTTTSNSRPLSRQSPQHSFHNNNNNNDDYDDTEAAALPSATDKSLLPMSAHGPTQSTKATTTTTAACGSPLPEAAGAAASPMYLPHSTASPPPMQSPSASSGLYSHHTCYYQALPPCALRPQASPYSANATAGSPPSAQLARTTTNNTAARLTPASSPLHAAGPLQLGSVAASYYCEPSAEPDPAVDCKIAARFVFDAQRGVLLIDPCQEVCRYMAQSELSSSRRCAMSGCGPCATSTSNGKAVTAPETASHGGCSAVCGDNVNKDDDEEEGDGVCGCSADFIAKDVRGVDYSGYHAHELYDHCSLCQRRPAAFLCLHCLQAFCPSHVARHHAQDPANCTLFLNVLDILTCFKRIFWCERCRRFTWRYTDVYEPLVDQIVYTRGTYLTRPVHDMHCIGFEAQLHYTNYNNNGSNDNVHATTSQDPTSSNSFSPYVLPAAMSSCPGTVPVLVPSLNERVTTTTMMMTPGTPRALDCTLNNMNTSGEGNAVNSSSGSAMLLPPSTALMHAMGSPRYHGTKEKEEEGQQEKESTSSPSTHASQREQQHVVSALDAAHGTACELAQTNEAQPVAGRTVAISTAVNTAVDTTTQAASGVVIVQEPNIATGEGATGHAADKAQSYPTTTMPAARQRDIALGDPVTRLSALSASMQGWRSTQEDAATAFLITLPSFTTSSSPSKCTQAGQSVTAQATTTASNGLHEKAMSPPHDTPSAVKAPATPQATQAQTTLSAGSNDNERNDTCSPALASAPLPPPVLSSSSAATSPLVMDETDGTPMAVFCVFDGHGGDAVAKLAAEHFESHLSQAMRRVRPEDSAAQALLRSVRSDSLGPASVRTPPLQQQQQQQQEVTGCPLVSALDSNAVNNNNTTNVVVMGEAVAGRRGSVGSAVPSSAAASPMTLSTVYAASPTLTSTTTGTTTTNNAKDLLTPYVGSHHHHIQQQQQTTMTPSPPTLLASATTTTTTGSEAGMTSGGGGHAVHITSATATAAADRGSGAAGLYGSFGSGRSGGSGADFLAQSVPLQSNSPAKTGAMPTLDIDSTVHEHKGLSTPHITPSGIALMSDQTGSNTTCPTYRQTVHSNSHGEAVKMPDTTEAGQTPPQTQSMMGLPHVLPISPEQRLRQPISTTTSSVIPHEVAHSHSPAALRQTTAPRLRLRPCPVVSDVGHNAVASGSLSKSNSGSSFTGKAACKDTLREERERLQPQTSSPPRTFAVTHTSTPPIQPATSVITRESTRQPSSLGYLSCLSPPPSLSSSSSPLYMRHATRGQQQHEEGEEDEGGDDERLRSHAHSPHPAIPSPPQLHTSHTTTTTSMRADRTRIATNTTGAAPTPSPPLRATMTGSPALPHHSRQQVPLLVQHPSSPSRVYISAHEMTLLRDYFARIMTDALLSLDAFLQHTVEGERGDYGCVGCTACVVGITSHFILCANVGDSGAALYTPETIEMISVTQRVNQPKERNRILQAGYTIVEDRIEGLLAVPRALGDFDFKQCGGKTAAEQAVTAVPEVTIRPVPLRRTSAQPLPHSFSSSSSLPLAPAATIERGGKGRHAEGSPDTTYNDNMGYYSNNNMNVYNSHASGSGSNECEYGKWGVLVACDGVWDTATLHQVHYALTHTTNELDVASSATAAVLRGRECLREGLYCHDMPDNDTTAGAARQSPSHTAQSPPPSDTSFAARHTPDMPTKPPPPTTITTAAPVRGSGEDERHATTTTTTANNVVGADRQTVACPTQQTSAATAVADNSNAAVTSHDEVGRGTQPMPYTSVADNNSHHSGSSAWHTPVLQRTQSSASPHAGLLGGAAEQAHTSQPQQQHSVTEGLQRRRSGRVGSCAEAECGIDARLLTAAAGVFAQCIAPADNDEGIGLDNCSLILIERRA